jgi:hypothetical protein
MPSRSASAGASSTQASGADSWSSRARPVFVRVWKWCTVRPVVNLNGYSSLGSSSGGMYSAALRNARPPGSCARYSSGSFCAPLNRSWP